MYLRACVLLSTTRKSSLTVYVYCFSRQRFRVARKPKSIAFAARPLRRIPCLRKNAIASTSVVIYRGWLGKNIPSNDPLTPFGFRNCPFGRECAPPTLCRSRNITCKRHSCFGNDNLSYKPAVWTVRTSLLEETVVS